ncbi:zinc finger CCCH domain-containing protein 14 [Synchiropus splendidus]|uniref:zinc finger CCCH domain-containing protein 14 n=1 Tax=Synchiropus splendidus TaxID=270530 RepID=UPI00237D6BB8|nr:zinc finger CCCH domain-containing protein 14 [Synchiropus splendidus]
MEIGTEISKKIRAAIKAKLQELGAYIDEELPDYIMVMVANKKTSQQMADDLALFLGNNTIKFTAWLHGVLEKLRSVAVEPESLKHPSDYTVTIKAAGADGRAENSKALTVTSTRTDRTEACVSSSAYETRQAPGEKGPSRLTTAVKPLVEPLPSDVIDIKPEMDDDLIDDSRSSGRAAAHQESRSSRSSRSGSKVEVSRKRKAPVASSVVRVNREEEDDSDDVEEDEGHRGRGVSSRVSLPSKPERKPSLPPAMQANRNLILKAISEAQDSITKTTAYPAIPQRRTAPVAPRARLASSRDVTAALQLVQEHLHTLAPQAQTYTPSEIPTSRTVAPARSVSSRLQVPAVEQNSEKEPSEENEEVTEIAEARTFDTRSIIVSQPQQSESQSRNLSQPKQKEEVQSALPRTVQPSNVKEQESSASPKFIVTLDGIPSPLGDITDFDMEDESHPSRLTDASVQSGKMLESGDRISQAPPDMMEDEMMEDEMMMMMMEEEEDEEESIPYKKQKGPERCKFWPVCKTGDECPYHHPTTPCKTFPNCQFGDKCLFVHPNCKFDARCTKPDCPFTHASVRKPKQAAPVQRPAPPTVQTPNACRFFPECKKMDCPFYHPKPCRYAGACKRPDCTFFHPNVSVPPRHALKWSKAQSSTAEVAQM